MNIKGFFIQYDARSGHSINHGEICVMKNFLPVEKCSIKINLL